MENNPSKEKYQTSNNTDSFEMTTEERASLSASIKKRLRAYHLTQVWLINRLSEQGTITDKSEMSSILAGVRFGFKAKMILRDSDKILITYAAKNGVGKTS